MNDQVRKEKAENFAQMVINAAVDRGLNVMICVEGVNKYTGDLDRILYGSAPNKKDDFEPSLKDFFDAVRKTVIGSIGNMPARTDEDIVCEPNPWVGLNEGEHYFLKLRSTDEPDTARIDVLKGVSYDTSITIGVLMFKGPLCRIYRRVNGDIYFADWYTVPTAIKLSGITWGYAFDEFGPLMHDLVERLVYWSFSIVPAETNVVTMTMKPNVNFVDFRTFLKNHVKSDVSPYLFEERERRKWMFRLVPGSKSEYMMFYVPEEDGEPYCVAGFKFKDTPNGLECYLIPYNTEGKVAMPYEDIMNNMAYVVFGNTHIDMSNSGTIVTRDNSWPNVFNKYYRGDLIRIAIWNMLSREPEPFMI